MYRGVFENGLPCIDIRVLGGADTHQPIRAVIDTGYNGHLTLPYQTAFPLGLTLLGIESARQADGTFSPFLSCLGTVVLGDTRVRATIDVQQGARALIGTALLADLAVTLTLNSKQELVELVPTPTR